MRSNNGHTLSMGNLDCAFLTLCLMVVFSKSTDPLKPGVKSRKWVYVQHIYIFGVLEMNNPFQKYEFA